MPPASSNASSVTFAPRATPPSADGLLALRGVIEAPEEVEDPQARAALEVEMARTVEAALDALKGARNAEGAQLAPLLADFIARIEGLVASAEGEAQAQVAAIRDLALNAYVGTPSFGYTIAGALMAGVVKAIPMNVPYKNQLVIGIASAGGAVTVPAMLRVVSTE